MRKRNRYDEPMEFDNNKRMRILRLNEDEHVVEMIILEPNIEDLQHHVVSQSEIELGKEIWERSSGVIGLQHRNREGDLFELGNFDPFDECWQYGYQDSFELLSSVITSQDTIINNQRVKEGSWLLSLRVLDDNIWEKIQNEELTGASVGALAITEVQNGYSRIFNLLPMEISLVSRPANARTFLRKALEALRNPFISEFSCRLPGGDPDNFQKDSFRRMSRESGGKTLDVIIARPKGSTKTREQAYRYSLDAGWTKASSQAHCSRHKGQFHDIERKEE